MFNDSRDAVEAWLQRNARLGDHLGFYGSLLKLPPLDPGIIAEQGPYAEAYPRPPGAGWPEFIIVIPVQQFENEHEWNLPDERWQELKQGQWDYDMVLAVQTRSLFHDRPINWVNPPVRVFVRRDIVPRLRDREKRLELR